MAICRRSPFADRMQPRSILFRYAVTVFLSAFLLFAVQPMVSRILTPRFGGTAAVWTSCLFFFQTVLLGGYMYVHVMRRYVSPRWSWILHAVLLALAAGLVQLSALFSGNWDPSRGVATAVVLALGTAIGLPFFVLSTTGPLIQAWSDLSHPRHDPYRLYALSNTGSLLALLSYPFLVEPYLPLSQQSRVWTLLFFGFCLSAFWAGIQIRTLRSWSPPGKRTHRDDTGENRVDAALPESEVAAMVAAEPAIDTGMAPAGTHPDAEPKRGAWPWWLGLSATGSLVLMSISNVIGQEVASFPFLWVLPLALYLTSFIISFEYPGCYRRWIAYPMFLLFVVGAVVLFHLGTKAPLLYTTLGMSGVCFLGCWVCHGELYRMRPPTGQLTLFYVWIAVGGAAGGMFVSMLAPHVFDGMYEFHLALSLAIALPAVLMGLIAGRSIAMAARAAALLGALAALGVLGASISYLLDPELRQSVVFQDRNEYGVVTVVDQGQFRYLVNGQTIHGGQSLNETFRDLPTLYYLSGSGAEVAINAMRDQRRGSAEIEPKSAAGPVSANEESLSVGVLGLGAGSMAAWGQAGDRFWFYELNPMVVQVASRYFQYIPGDAANGATNSRGVWVQVVTGDGRASLARRPSDQENFDLLFVDAFTSDSIPVHLLTVEALEQYRRCVKPDGFIVFHVTNRFVDLLPVLRGLSEASGMQAIYIEHDNPSVDTTTRWVILVNASQSLPDRLSRFASDRPLADRSIRWTDDLAALAPVVMWRDSPLRGRSLTVDALPPESLKLDSQQKTTAQ